jgi:hypothetical protein
MKACHLRTPAYIVCIMFNGRSEICRMVWQVSEMEKISILKCRHGFAPSCSAPGVPAHTRGTNACFASAAQNRTNQLISHEMRCQGVPCHIASAPMRPPMQWKLCLTSAAQNRTNQLISHEMRCQGVPCHIATSRPPPPMQWKLCLTSAA